MKQKKKDPFLVYASESWNERKIQLLDYPFGCLLWDSNLNTRTYVLFSSLISVMKLLYISLSLSEVVSDLGAWIHFVFSLVRQWSCHDSCFHLILGLPNGVILLIWCERNSLDKLLLTVAFFQWHCIKYRVYWSVKHIKAFRTVLFWFRVYIWTYI